MIAALYVETGGPYFGLPDVDPWDLERDARRYAGPHPVVAHPPCKRWGRYWSGGPSHHGKFRLGADGGCFAAALESVQRWGGVLEHPEASHAFGAHHLAAPPKDGGWIPAGLFAPGFVCCVEQGAYGHVSRKATWLYACGLDAADLPELRWGDSGKRLRLDRGYRTTDERRRAELAAKDARSGSSVERLLTKRERLLTPEPFRDLLLSIARLCQPEEARP